MIEILETHPETSQEPVAEDGDPPKSSFSPTAAALHERLLAIIDAPDHETRKELSDALIEPNVRCGRLFQLHSATREIRRRLNGSLNPQMSKRLNGLEYRVKAEIEMHKALIG